MDASSINKQITRYSNKNDVVTTMIRILLDW